MVISRPVFSSSTTALATRWRVVMLSGILISTGRTVKLRMVRPSFGTRWPEPARNTSPLATFSKVPRSLPGTPT
jgi:hypothetical protein